MYNCIIKALNRTISNLAVNFSSNDNTVTVITDRSKRNHTSAEQISQGVIKSTSSELITSTPKNAKQAKRHHSTPDFDDSVELKTIESVIGSDADDSKINYVAEISGDIYNSFEEADVFSTSEEFDKESENDGIKFSKEHDNNDNDCNEFVYNDFYWEDDIRDFLYPESDMCSCFNEVKHVGLFKGET